MSKKSPVVERVWHGSLLILGSVVALSLAIQLLTGIWGWLVLAAGAALLIAAIRFWLHSRRDGW